MNKKYHLTQLQIEEIKRRYPDTIAQELADGYGVSVRHIYTLAKKYAIKKDKAFISATTKERLSSADHGSVSTRFKKGTPSPNKGKKQSEFLSEEGIAASMRTRFPKGHIPHNTKPVGFERVSREGYIEIKTAEPNVFRLKHRIVWEQHFGSIPDGGTIVFKNNSRQDVSIENLILCSRENLMRRNTLSQYPEDLAQAIKLTNRLKRQIIKKKNV